MATVSDGIVGRGNADGAALFRDWFSELTSAAEAGRGAAYVFVMGSMAELLRCFDFPIVFPEINSLQTAVRHVAHEFLNEAEDYGYSPDICGYVKADVATQMRGGQLPMGRIPKPAVAVYTNACNTYIKWAEIWERMHGMPTFTVDVPGSRAAGLRPPPGDADFEHDRKYVQAQIETMIPELERISGVKFDIDRLRESMGHANTMSRGWKRVLELNQSTPSLFNALTDGTIYLGVFGELFTEWGGTFVNSTYLWFASGGANAGFEYDLSRPMESLAEGLLLSTRDAMDSMFFQTDVLLEMFEAFGADGVVYHPIKSCRTVSTGLADNRRALMEKGDIPSLYIESDMMDRRVVSEAQLKNRIDAFFEGLASRKRTGVTA
ncbi:MAG: 2-hydroxyacyl-CoA dehydratase family protein [Gemmatimonadota bacterium]